MFTEMEIIGVCTSCTYVPMIYKNKADIENTDLFPELLGDLQADTSVAIIYLSLLLVHKDHIRVIYGLELK